MDFAQVADVLAFLSGLFAGSLHVVSGPDHLAAIAPLALRDPRTGSTLGAVWGLGHGGGVALWMAAAALLRAFWGYELAPDVLEAGVGVALLALGAVSYLRSAHEQAEHRHTHAAALALGALHGSAGATHLLALLPTLGLPSQGVLSYAGGYLLAGVSAMAGFASLVGKLSVQVPDLTKTRRVCAVLVIALGAVWLGSALAHLT